MVRNQEYTVNDGDRLCLKSVPDVAYEFVFHVGDADETSGSGACAKSTNVRVTADQDVQDNTSSSVVGTLPLTQSQLDNMATPSADATIENTDDDAHSVISITDSDADSDTYSLLDELDISDESDYHGDKSTWPSSVDSDADYDIVEARKTLLRGCMSPAEVVRTPVNLRKRTASSSTPGRDVRGTTAAQTTTPTRRKRSRGNAD